MTMPTQSVGPEPELIQDAMGYFWLRWPNGRVQMAPTTNSNRATPEPVTVYKPAGNKSDRAGAIVTVVVVVASCLVIVAAAARAAVWLWP